MGIIMMNLLVGLAVDDIKEVQDNAQLKKLSAQVKCFDRNHCDYMKENAQAADRQLLE